MPRRVKGPDGVVHEFPDDATDEEIGTALESLQKPYEPRPYTPQGTGKGIEAPEAGDPRRGWKENLADAMRPMAQPQNADDIGHLLMAPTGSIGGGMGEAARSIPGVLRSMRPSTATVGKAGRVLQQAGDLAMHPVQMPGRAIRFAGRKIEEAAERATPSNATGTVDYGTPRPDPNAGYPRGGTTAPPPYRPRPEVPDSPNALGGTTPPRPMPTQPATPHQTVSKPVSSHEPSRIIRPGPEADWVTRNPSGGGLLSPKEQEDLLRQYLMNFMRSRS